MQGPPSKQALWQPSGLVEQGKSGSCVRAPALLIIIPVAYSVWQRSVLRMAGLGPRTARFLALIIFRDDASSQYWVTMVWGLVFLATPASTKNKAQNILQRSSARHPTRPPSRRALRPGVVRRASEYLPCAGARRHSAAAEGSSRWNALCRRCQTASAGCKDGGSLCLPLGGRLPFSMLICWSDNQPMEPCNPL
jgi:hypothetical protein